VAQFYRGVPSKLDALSVAGWILSRDHHSIGGKIEAVTAIVSRLEQHRGIDRTVALLKPHNLVSLQLTETLRYQETNADAATDEVFQLYRKSQSLCPSQYPIGLLRADLSVCD